MLCSYVGDEPECNAVTCTKGGSTGFPCALCFVPREWLLDITRGFEVRTEAHQKVSCLWVGARGKSAYALPRKVSFLHVVLKERLGFMHCFQCLHPFQLSHTYLLCVVLIFAIQGALSQVRSTQNLTQMRQRCKEMSMRCIPSGAP